MVDFKGGWEWVPGSGASMGLRLWKMGQMVGPQERGYAHFRDCAQAVVLELFFTIEMRESEDRQNTKVVALRVFFPTM